VYGMLMKNVCLLGRHDTHLGSFCPLQTPSAPIFAMSIVLGCQGRVESFPSSAASSVAYRSCLLLSTSRTPSTTTHEDSGCRHNTLCPACSLSDP